MEKSAENVQITSEGIKNSLHNYKPLEALAEYVWNGFDAQANRVDIEIGINEIDGVNYIRVIDNGSGIDRSLLPQKFRPFFQSEKTYDPKERHSATHGKNGVGRLTFYTFANIAKWETVYRKDNELLSYGIEIDAAALEQYTPDEEKTTRKQTGTAVTFTDITSADITPDTARIYLAEEFCWFLELNSCSGYAIFVNGEELDYNNCIITKEDQHYIYEKTNMEYDVTYICWNRKLSEYSKYYYVKSDGTELSKENTTLNNKGDQFYHSVFIRSQLFDNFDFKKTKLSQTTLLGHYNMKSPEFEFIMSAVNRHLYDLRRPFVKKVVSKVINSLEIEDAFPTYDPNNVVDKFRKSQIEEMISAIYIAQPRIFTSFANKEQKKTFIRLLDLIMMSGEVDSLFSIFNEILDMSEDERHDLADILKYTHLSNVTKTIRLIKDRYKAVDDIKQLVYNPDLNANEVNHLQKLIERHYWLFGEQYNLVTAAEPNFVEALKRYLKYLHEEYEDASVEHPDKLKQMDIFAVRQDVSQGKFHNIVVELKHPNVRLGERQLSQVKQYMRVILSIDQFNASNMTWEFYLVGNRFDSTNYIEDELENNKVHGIPYLVFEKPRYKVYVMRWSELFADFEMRHSHLNKMLQLEKEKLQTTYTTADEVVAQQADNTAVMPKEMEPAI